MSVRAVNQLDTITTGSNVRTFGYLASGQVSGDQRTSTADYTFGTNNDGRLVSASLNGSGVGAYVYNGFEQRAKKSAGSAATDFSPKKSVDGIPIPRGVGVRPFRVD